MRNLILSNQKYSNSIGDFFNKNVVKNPFLNPVGAAIDKNKTAKETIQDASHSVKVQVDKTGENIEQVKKDVKHGGIVKAFIHQTSRFNPAAAIPRAGILAGYRLNMFGLSTRLFPAVATPQELKAGNFNLENVANAKKAWDKVSTFYYNLGGDASSLEKQIRRNYTKPVFNTHNAKEAKRAQAGFNGDEFSNLTGADDAAIAAAASALLGTMSKMISDSKAAKNPYNNKQIDTSGMDADTVATQQEIAQIQAAADADKAKGLGLDSGNSTILGIPSTVFYIGATIFGLGIIFGGYKLYQKYH